jgi:hypothetical protein
MDTSESAKTGSDEVEKYTLVRCRTSATDSAELAPPGPTVPAGPSSLRCTGGVLVEIL